MATRQFFFALLIYQKYDTILCVGKQFLAGCRNPLSFVLGKDVKYLQLYMVGGLPNKLNKAHNLMIIVSNLQPPDFSGGFFEIFRGVG